MSGRPGPTGRTRVAAVIGDPVAHSFSPTIHNAAFAAVGLDWVYVAFPVRAGDGAAAVAAVRALGLAGLSVTMPHKADAARACDELTPDAAALGAVNTVVPVDGRLVGDSTDGEGFLRALADDGVGVAGREYLVLGAGGAARAIVLALGRAGARVTVAARNLAASASAAALAPGSTTVPMTDVGASLPRADVVVNATPLGMRGEDPPFSPEILEPGQFVLDTVYHPLETSLLRAARARGVPGANGLGMLVHQAALAFERWTGRPAPVDAMRAAALDAVGS